MERIESKVCPCPSRFPFLPRNRECDPSADSCRRGGIARPRSCEREFAGPAPGKTIWRMTMNQFKTHDIASAPLEARTDLEKIKLNHGNVPNVYAVMAEAPVLLKGHIALKEQFEKATLNKQERKIVLLALSRELGSTYDTAVHSGAAEKHNVPMDAIEAIRAGAPLKDLKLEALRSFAAKLV